MKARPRSITTSSIATAVMVLTQVAPFAPSVYAETFVTPFGTEVDSGVLAGPDLIMNGGGFLFLDPLQVNLTGATTINDGTVLVTSASALGTTTGITIRGLPLNGIIFDTVSGAGGGNLTVGGGITIGSNITLRGFGATGTAAALTNVGANTFSGTIATGTGANTRIVSTAGTATFSGPVTISGSTTLLFGGNGATVISGPIGAVGTGAVLQKVNAGSLELRGASGFTGVVTLSAGNLRVSDGANVGVNTANNALTLAGGILEVRTGTGGFTNTGISVTATSTIFLDHAVGGTDQGKAVNFRNLVQTVNVTPTLSSRNGYGATFTQYTSNGGNNSPVTNNLSGLLTFGTGSGASFWNQTDGTARTLTISGTGDTTVNANITTGTAAHSLTKAGAGTLTLLASGTGSNLGGNTNIQAGTLALNSILALNNSATGTASRINIGNAAATGTLSFFGSGDAADYNVAKTVNLFGNAGGATINALQTGTSGVIINAYAATTSGGKTLTLGGTSTAANTVVAAITDSTGTAGGLVSVAKTGLGTWTLSGANTYSGSTTISGGTLKLNATGAASDVIASGTGNTIVFPAKPLTFTAGGTLEFNGFAGSVTTETLGGLISQGSAGMGTIRVKSPDANAANLVFTSITAGGTGGRTTGLNFDTTGASGGTVTITGLAAPTATTLPGDGHLYLNGADFAIADGTTGVLIAPAYGTTAGFVDAAAGAATLGAGSHNRVTGDITAQTAVTVTSLKMATHTLELSGNLTLNTNGAGSDGAILVTGGNTAAITTTGTFGITTGGAGALVIHVNQAGDALTLAAPMLATGSGGLTKNGAGTLNLNASNLQSGTTTINEGTVRIGSAGRLSGNGTALTLRQEGTLDLNGTTTATAGTAHIGAFNGAGTIANSSATPAVLSVGGSNGAGTFTGIIENGIGGGGVSVIKNGTGAQTWNGLNTYAGSTTFLSTGVVAIQSLADGGAPSGIGASGSAAGNLIFNGSGSATGANAGINYSSNISTTTNRLFTLAGDINNGGGRIQVNGIATGTATVTFTNTGPIAVTGTGTKLLTLGGNSLNDNTMNPQIVDGAGTATVGVWKADTGLWILGNSANTYTGATTIANGILQAQDGTSLPVLSNLVIGTGSTAASAIFQSSGNFTRSLGTGPGQVALLGTGSAANAGFAASSGKFNVDLGPATWGTANFLPGNQALLLNSTTALAEVDFTSSIDLGSANREIQVLDNTNAGTDVATVSGTISGSAGIIKTGAGLLNLGPAGTNAYTGDTEVRAGVLNVTSLGQNSGVGTSSVGAWGTGGVKLGINAIAGTLDYIGAGGSSSRLIQANGTSGATATIRSNGTGAVSLGNVVNSAASGTAGKTLTLAGENTGPNELTGSFGVLEDNVGPLSVTKAEGGVWSMSGANTYTGITTVSAGTLGVGADATGLIGFLASGPFGKGTLTLSGGNLAAVNGNRSIKNGVTITATSGFQGDNTIDIEAAVTLPASVTLNNFISTGNTLTITGNFTTPTAATATFGGSGDTIINGLITQTGTGAGMTLLVNATGGGSLRIGGPGGPNTYLGATTLTTGTLILDKVGAISTAGGTASPLNVNGGTALLNVVGAINTTTTVNSGGGFLAAASVAAGSIANVVNITNNNGGVSGTSTVELTGPLTVSAADRTFNNNISGSGQQLILSGPVNLSDSNTARTLTLGGSGNTLVSGVIGNGGTSAGSLTKQGGGTLILSNPGNFYGGGTNINGGTLRLGAPEVIPNTSIVTIGQQGPGSTSGVLDLNGNNESITGFNLGSIVAGTAGAIGGQTPLVTNTGAPATLTILSNITYRAGAAGVENGPALIDSSLILSLGTGTRTFTVGDSSAAPIDLTIAAQMVKTGTAAVGITKAGAGVLELTNAANAFDGAIAVNGGILRPTAQGALGVGTGAITVNANTAGANAVLDLNGTNQTAATLTFGGSSGSTATLSTGTGTLTVGGTVTDTAAGNPNGSLLSGNLSLGAATRTFTIGDSSAAANDLTVSALITKTGTGAVGIIKAGAGTLALTNPANTFNGVTTINAGILNVTKLSDGGVPSGIGQAAATANQLVINGSTLAYTGTGDSTDKLFTIGAGTAGATIDSSGAGPLNFTAAGPIAIAAGTVARTLIFTASNTGGANIFSPIIPSIGTNGPVGVVKQGAGTWQLNAVNTYAGGTTIQAGTLSVGSGGSLGTGPVTVLTGGTLSGSGTVGAVTTQPGSTISPGNSIGTLAGTSLNMSAGGTFKLEVDTTVAGAPTNDTMTLSAGLTLSLGTLSVLDVTDLAAISNVIALPLGTRLAFITYGGTQSGLFSVGGVPITDYDTDPLSLFTVGANQFGIDYNDGTNKVSLVAVPEPGTVGSLIGSFGLLLGIRRRRNAPRGA